MRKFVFGFPTRSDKNEALQPQNIDRGLYEISDFEKVVCSESKVAVYLRLCFLKVNVVSWFSRKISVTKTTQTLQLTIVFCVL